jgi:hypothetical protein
LDISPFSQLEIQDAHMLTTVFSHHTVQKKTDYDTQGAVFKHAVFSHRGGPGSNLGLVLWDFVMDKSGAGTGFLRELRFPLPIYIPSSSPQSSSLSPKAGTIGQEWPQCQ